MESVNPDMLMQLVYSVLGAGAVYGGIRADIKAMHERIKGAEESVGQAHRRIDAHLEKG